MIYRCIEEYESSSNRLGDERTRSDRSGEERRLWHKGSGVDIEDGDSGGQQEKDLSERRGDFI